MDWWFAQLFRYGVLCLVGWVLGGVLISGTSEWALSVFGFVLIYGPLFRALTVTVLVPLYFVGRDIGPGAAGRQPRVHRQDHPERRPLPAVRSRPGPAHGLVPRRRERGK
jgi:hypothetical protein